MPFFDWLFSKEPFSKISKSCVNCFWSEYKGQVCKQPINPAQILTVEWATLCVNYTTTPPSFDTTTFSAVLGTNFKLDSLKTAIDATKTATEAVQTAVESQSAKLDEIKTSTEGTTTALGTTNTKLDTVKASTDTVKTAIDLTKTAIDSTKTAVDSMNADVKGKLDLNKTAIDSVAAKTDLVKGSTDLIQTALGTTNTKLTDVKVSVDANKTSTDTVSTNVQALPPRLTFFLQPTEFFRDNTIVSHATQTYTLKKTATFTILPDMMITLLLIDYWADVNASNQPNIKVTAESDLQGETTIFELHVHAPTRQTSNINISAYQEYAAWVVFRLYLQGLTPYIAYNSLFQVKGSVKTLVAYET